MRIGLIRVRTLDAVGEVDSHGPLTERAFPGLQVTCHCIKDQPYGIHDEESEARAIPKVVDLGMCLANTVDAIIVSCAADPGVDVLRRELRIPVIGPGRSAAGIARTLGKATGVITLTDAVPAVVRDGLGDCFLTWKKVQGVKTGLDFQSEAGYRNALKAAEELAASGSETLLLACTGLSSIGIAPRMSAALGIPVVDPLLAAGSVAYVLMLARSLEWSTTKGNR